MNKIVNIMRKSIITNIFLAIVKIVTGIFSGSSAMLADGIHSTSDLVTDLIAIIGSVLAKRPADKNHPYGHGKYEYITSIIISVIIIILGSTIIYSSVSREIVVPNLIALFVTIITILVKLILSNYIIRKGKEMGSNILISSGYESRTDVVSSVVVLISIALMQLASVNKIFGYADIVASVIVGIFIVRIGFILAKENVSTILGEQETDELILNSVTNVILGKDGVLGVDSLVLLKYGAYYKLSAEIAMDKDRTLADVHGEVEEIEILIKKHNQSIKYIIIHVNPKEER